MTATCPSCGQPVIHAGDRVMTAQPTRLGIYDPTSGHVLTAPDITRRIRETRLAGHGNHQCPAPEQDTLPLDLQETTR